MKKIIVFILLLIPFFSQTAGAYIPSEELTESLQIASEKLGTIISEKGEIYRAQFLEIITEYQVEYIENEKATYILGYLYTSLSISTNSSQKNENPNILLIIADDMGLDVSPGFSEGDIKPNMPNLEAMIENGLVFENLWSAPTCTPTRSTILTGKYGVHTNMIQVGDILATTETSLHSYLDSYTNNSYSHAVIGKWHLSNDPSHPTQMGVDYYAGMLSGTAKSYWNWQLSENGKTTTETEYATSKFSDLAIDWKAEQEKPWFLWLAYNAPHTPFHLPPSELHSQKDLDDSQSTIDENPLPYYIAALEAMDSEIGRFLDSLSETEQENTLIIFIGDNGTPNQVAQAPYTNRTAKGSLFQGGINVPMVVSGAGVSRVGERETALINTSDIFATVLDIANTGVNTMHDSQSFQALFTDKNGEKREYIYAEVGGTPQSGHTIRDDTYKLLNLDNGATRLYDLASDPYEANNLLRGNGANIYSDVVEKLQSKIDEIRN